MPQNEAKFQVNQFTGGLVTDSNPLESSGAISIDENNCEILSHGGRRRKRGAGLELAFETHTTSVTNTQKEEWAFETFEWSAVAGIPNLDFVVYQQGPTLWFYDKSASPLSQGLKSFSVNLQTYRITSATAAEVENTLVSVATGKGVIFVCGPTINPFYVEYDQVTDTISETAITIEIRDFEEQAPEVGPQDIVGPSPTTGRHLYDLLNQGWYKRGPWMRDQDSTNRSEDPVIVLYYGNSDIGLKFPRKNTPWHVGKYIVTEDDGRESYTFIGPQQVKAAPSGNTLAPFGHYILNAFDKDRAQAVKDEHDLTIAFALANLNTIPVETEDERPVACAFYAGRAWYGLKNNLYFSQQLDEDSLEKAGKCYQEGDPTNEGESDIVATDGGVISIPNMGRVTGLAITDNALIVFATNGIWFVSGTNGSSFTAVDFTVNKLSTTRCKSQRSIVEAEGLVFFWSDNGIHVIQPGEVRDFPQIKDISEGRITEFYNDIPQASKRNTKGVYDPNNKIIYWMYKGAIDSSGVAINRFAYDKFLNFSLKFSAFFPWSITANSSYQIISGVVAGGLSTQFTEENVVDSGGEEVVDSNGDNVVVFTPTVVEIEEAFKFMALKDNAATFGSFDNYSFLDWDDEGEGANYTSYIETFYHIQDDYMAFMQAPYVYAYFRRTEESQVAVPAGPFTYEQIAEGGSTFASEFISELGDNAGGTNLPSLSSQGLWVVGEDGKKYLPAIGGGGVGSQVQIMRLYDVDLGTTISALDKDEDEMKSDAISAGFFTAGNVIGGEAGQGHINVTPIAGTQYFIVIGSQYGGVDSSKTVYYYKINSNSELELVNAWAGREDGLDISTHPEVTNASAYTGVGVIGASAYKVELDEEDDEYETHNTVWHQYPLVLTYSGSSPTAAKGTVIPSINAAVQDLFTNESTASGNIWDPRELDFSSPFDANIFRLSDATPADANRRRAFIMPSSSGAVFYIPFYLTDIEEHIATTQTTTSSYLQTHDSTYPTGLMSSVPVTLTAVPSDEWGFNPGFGSVTVNAHSDYTGYPFSDETEEFDGSAGTSDDNYTMPPSVYPFYENNVLGPWAMFTPKVFRNDPDSIEIKISVYDPVSGEAKLVDSMKGQLLELGTDVSVNLLPLSCAVFWDKTDGSVYINGLYVDSVTGLQSIITAKVGTWTPVVNGFSGNPLVEGVGLQTIESSCFLTTMWDWANTTASGKVSTPIQIYRRGRVNFVSDTSNPDPTGLPVYVSKNKTRGRGRALQLRFASEEGKDFELYGWAVWAGKNTRF